jgi:hypothetical protein
MKIVFASSPSHDVLKRHFFLGTLCESWELIELRFALPGDGNFGSQSWNRVVIERNARVLEIIKRSPGEIIVFADVDIQWFRPVQAALVRELAGNDVVFQREAHNRQVVNCGFAAIRCNEQSAELYAQIAAAATEGKHDQDLVNEYIAGGTMPCRYGILPQVFFNDNLDGVHAPPNDRLLLYHSIGTFPSSGKSSVQIKLEKHLAMRARVLGSDAVFQPIPDLPVGKANRAAASDESFPARNYFLTTGDRRRCGNLIIHPNGRMYGDVPALGCARWTISEGRLVFFDHAGRVRFVFEKADDGCWNYRVTGPREPRRGEFKLQDGTIVPLFTPSADYQLTPHPQFQADRKSFEMVVAKYMEDMAWTDAYPRNATIYSKDQAADLGQYTVLPNLGREGGSYLYHISRRYDQLADQTLFLQGDPFPHPMLPFCDYASAGPFAVGADSRQNMDWTIPWSSPSQRIDRPVMEDFLRVLECDPAMATFRWTQGAQFALSRGQIHQRSRSYYQKLFELTQQHTVELAGRRFDNHHVAWLFELFWRYVFLAGEL